MLQLLTNNWQLLSILPIYLSLILNCVVIIDLYLTLKNPFYPNKKRLPKLWGLVILFMITPSYLVYLLYGTPSWEDLTIISDTFLALSATTLVLMLIPIVLVINRLRKRGTSPALRKKVVNTYVIYMIVYSLTAFGIVNDQSSLSSICKSDQSII